MATQTMSIGDGGWARVHLDGSETTTLIRFSEDDAGRLRVTEAYFDGAITGDVLRSIRVAELEGEANHPLLRSFIRERMSRNGMDLRSQTKMFRAAKTSVQPEQRSHITLEVPSSKPYPESFFRQVAAAYMHFVALGEPPGKSIAEVAGIGDRPTTAHRWIRRARDLGHLPEGTPGRAG